MTSNLGSEQLLEKIGTKSSEWTKDAVLSIVEPILKKHFRPEFLNRLDEILPFLPLQQKDMEKIVILQMKKVQERLEDKRIQLTWTQDVISHLAEEGYDPFFGARPLKRMIQQEVVNQLSTGLLKGDLLPDTKAELTLAREKSGNHITYKVC